MGLEKKVALVTGGAQGIGLGIARVLVGQGASVYLCDLNEEGGRKAVEKLRADGGGAAFFQRLDVTCEASWIAAFGTVMAAQGRMDILINNAGINVRKPIETMDVEGLDAMLAVNVKGPFIGIKHAIPLLRKAGGGSIVNISSICGLVGHKYTTEAYTMTKGALTLLTKSVATRYARDNIRCNSVHPSTVETLLTQELFKDPAKKQERLDEVPLGRLATTRDVAQAVLYLVSEEGSFLNGVALPVDGGLCAY